jgi:hypothetical protein
MIYFFPEHTIVFATRHNSIFLHVFDCLCESKGNSCLKNKKNKYIVVVFMVDLTSFFVLEIST